MVELRQINLEITPPRLYRYPQLIIPNPEQRRFNIRSSPSDPRFPLGFSRLYSLIQSFTSLLRSLSQSRRNEPRTSIPSESHSLASSITIPEPQISLARHILLKRGHHQRHPEIGEQALGERYIGGFSIGDSIDELNMTLAEVFLSPTRIYASTLTLY